MRNTLSSHKQTGFTIVELLIVIVVIAILAAITIVSYNGIQLRASETLLVSDLSSASKQLEQTKTTNTDYPNNANDVKKSTKTTFTYIYTASTNTYCLTGVSSNSAVPKYFVSSSQLTPQKGECPPPAPDVWAVSTQASTVQLGCVSGCVGSLQINTANNSYMTGTVSQVAGDETVLFGVQYACNSGSCGNVTFTITAEPPFSISDEIPTTWSQSLTRGLGTVGQGNSGSRYYSMRAPAGASAGTARIRISSASSNLTNARIFTAEHMVMTK